MNRAEDRRNERGVTLVELLASIILITLILTTFITIYMQSARTLHTSDKIVDATYIAQTEMEKLYSVSVKTSYGMRESAIVSLGYEKRSDAGDWILFQKPAADGWTFQVRLQKRPEKENMNHVIVEVLRNSDGGLEAKMENILHWGADAE